MAWLIASAIIAIRRSSRKQPGSALALATECVRRITWPEVHCAPFLLVRCGDAAGRLQIRRCRGARQSQPTVRRGEGKSECTIAVRARMIIGPVAGATLTLRTRRRPRQRAEERRQARA
jgi:hypothetical protein